MLTCKKYASAVLHKLTKGKRQIQVIPAPQNALIRHAQMTDDTELCNKVIGEMIVSRNFKC